MIKLVLAAIGATVIAVGSAAAQGLPPLPDAIKPSGFNGYALNVIDLEKERAFYEQAFGMKVAGRIPETGNLIEYLMNWTGARTDRPLIVLNKVAGPRQQGQDAAGRIIIGAPNAAELARRVVAAGGTVRGQIREGTYNFVFDPEGNLIELYQAPAPRPAAASATRP
jgi:catechol 2,3-dioxygenase-like lactoylglutathione lyase family enzyme